ncbi:ankyrin, partial [Colletotrichum eremochloae]
MTPLHLAVGSAKSNDWYASTVVLNSGIRNKGCAFGAVAQPHHPVMRRSVFEMRDERLKEYYNRSDAMKWVMQSSDSEYEIKRLVFNNDTTGAENLPFDSLFGIAFSLEAPCHPLLEAVISKHQTPTERQEALAEYMLQSGAPVNARTKGGITPLIASVRQGRLDLANLLLKHGADSNIADTGGCTPLIVAARSGRQDLVEALLASGADAD